MSRLLHQARKVKKKALYCHIQVTYTPSSLFPPTNCDPAYILSSIWGQEHEGVAGLWKQNAAPSLTAPKPMTLVPGKTRGKSAELSPFGMHIPYVSQQDGVHLPSINRLQFVPWFQVGLWRVDPAAHASIWFSAHVLSFSLGHHTYDFCWSPSYRCFFCSHLLHLTEDYPQSSQDLGVQVVLGGRPRTSGEEVFGSCSLPGMGLFLAARRALRIYFFQSTNRLRPKNTS